MFAIHVVCTLVALSSAYVVAFLSRQGVDVILTRDLGADCHLVKSFIRDRSNHTHFRRLLWHARLVAGVLPTAYLLVIAVLCASIDVSKNPSALLVALIAWTLLTLLLTALAVRDIEDSYALGYRLFGRLEKDSRSLRIQPRINAIIAGGSGASTRLAKLALPPQSRRYLHLMFPVYLIMADGLRSALMRANSNGVALQQLVDFIIWDTSVHYVEMHSAKFLDHERVKDLTPPPRPLGRAQEGRSFQAQGAQCSTITSRVNCWK